MKRLFGLIGNPLEHSFSKDYFTRFFEANSIDAEYRNFELEDISDLMELVAEYPELCGLNVTSPFKQQILPYIDNLTEDAREIDAVNVVKITHESDDLIFEGYNADSKGFMLDIEPFVKAGSKALVLGSGGASNAVVHALRKLGCNPVVVSRNAGDGKITYTDITPEYMHDVTLIVNATPLGMLHNPDEMPPIPYELITPKMLCYDLIYNPSPTRFMAECAKRGAAVKGGLGMLINQAVISWEIWNK